VSQQVIGSDDMAISILNLLRKAYENQASDVHISYGLPAVFRINGELTKLDQEVIQPTDLTAMITEILPTHKEEEFKEKGETDFNYSLTDLCRFRVNAYHQQGEVTIAARLIPAIIPTIEQLGLPKVIYDLAEKPHGLVLVTGPTGSGKSTTLAAMIHHINTNYAKHILTIEDPIEYFHPHQQSIIHQREIGIDTKSFATGLRAALRQDPDILLVGEMRDLETISTAITAAETGHLVFATLHTSSAATTIDRIIDVFPPEQQNQIRIQIANVLQGVISQRLLLNKDGTGRVAATEILVSTPAVSNLIRSEKIHQIPNVIQTNRQLGMHTLASSIQQLIADGNITTDEAKPYMQLGEL
jgi:twitching motility protein PilT